METMNPLDAGICDHGAQLLLLLQADAWDAALQAGLMDYAPCPACDAVVTATLVEAQQHFLKAWAARDRYVARNTRLTTRSAAREQKRCAETARQHQLTSLPPAAAAILARAKAKAAERGKP